MKTLKTLLVCSLVFALSFSLYARKKKKAAAPEVKQELNFDDIKKLKYTTEQINNLKKSAEYRKATYTYSGYVSSMPFPKDRKKAEKLRAKYAKKGEYPMRIIVSIKETKESRGKKKTTAYYKSNAYIYIIDMEKKVMIESERKSLKKLCAT